MLLVALSEKRKTIGIPVDVMDCRMGGTVVILRTSSMVAGLHNLNPKFYEKQAGYFSSPSVN